MAALRLASRLPFRCSLLLLPSSPQGPPPWVLTERRPPPGPASIKQAAFPHLQHLPKMREWDSMHTLC